MVVAVVSLVWSGFTILFWFVVFILSQRRPVEGTTLNEILFWVYIISTTGCPILAFAAIGQNIPKHMKVIVGIIAVAIPAVLFVILYIYVFFIIA